MPETGYPEEIQEQQIFSIEAASLKACEVYIRREMWHDKERGNELKDMPTHGGLTPPKQALEAEESVTNTPPQKHII